MNRLIFILLILAFIIGWIFPVEGPLDWTYDKYASQPAHYRPKKAPTRVAPAQKPVKEIFIDLDEDDEPEWYLIIPKPSDTVGEPEE